MARPTVARVAFRRCLGASFGVLVACFALWTIPGVQSRLTGEDSPEKWGRPGMKQRLLPRVDFSLRSVPPTFAFTQEYGEAMAMLLAPGVALAIGMLVVGFSFMCVRLCCLHKRKTPKWLMAWSRIYSAHAVFIRYSAFFLLALCLAIFMLCAIAAISGIRKSHTTHNKLVHIMYETANSTLTLLSNLEYALDDMKGLNLTLVDASLPPEFDAMDETIAGVRVEVAKYITTGETHRDNLYMVELLRIALLAMVALFAFLGFTCALGFLSCNMPYPASINGIIGFPVASVCVLIGSVLLVVSVAKSDICVGAAKVYDDDEAVKDSVMLGAIAGCVTNGTVEMIRQPLLALHDATLTALEEFSESRLQCTVSRVHSDPNYWGKLLDAGQVFCPAVSGLHEACHFGVVEACTTIDELNLRLNLLQRLLDILERLLELSKCEFAMAAFRLVVDEVCKKYVSANDVEMMAYWVMGFVSWSASFMMIIAPKLFSDYQLISAASVVHHDETEFYHEPESPVDGPVTPHAAESASRYGAPEFGEPGSHTGGESGSHVDEPGSSHTNVPEPIA